MTRKTLLALLLTFFCAYILGYNQALTSLATDMKAGKLILLDKGLIMQIRLRRILTPENATF